MKNPHKLVMTVLDPITPSDFAGRTYRVAINCTKCRSQWALTTDVPNQAVRILNPDASKSRVEDFYSCFQDRLIQKAKSFIDFHHDINEESAYECKEKEA